MLVVTAVERYATVNYVLLAFMSLTFSVGITRLFKKHILLISFHRAEAFPNIHPREALKLLTSMR